MLCTSLVEEPKKGRTLAILQLSGSHRGDGTPSKTWDLPLPLAQATA